MAHRIGILNFNQCYKNQNFYRRTEYEYIDFSSLSSANGYCSPKTLELIKRKLREKDRFQIHFIGTGNYHYMTYLFLERIREPFSLVLFDHHTDILPPLCPELLSCGCWVKRVLDENKYIKEVLILGAKQELIDAIEPRYLNRVKAYSKEFLGTCSHWMELAAESVHYPFYCSVDKDVFRKSEACTNWDQGNMTGKDFLTVSKKIWNRQYVLGVDVCGESAEVPMGHGSGQETECNNKANKMILNFLLKNDSAFRYPDIIKKVG